MTLAAIESLYCRLPPVCLRKPAARRNAAWGFVVYTKDNKVAAVGVAGLVFVAARQPFKYVDRTAALAGGGAPFASAQGAQRP